MNDERENIQDNPKSYVAWKNEAARLQARVTELEQKYAECHRDLSAQIGELQTELAEIKQSEAVKSVFEEMKSLSDEAFYVELEKHKQDPLTQMFLEADWRNSLARAEIKNLRAELKSTKARMWENGHEIDRLQAELERVTADFKLRVESYDANSRGWQEDIATLRAELERVTKQLIMVQDERAASFDMLKRTVGKCGLTAYQPEVDLEINARIEQIKYERDQLRVELAECKDFRKGTIHNAWLMAPREKLIEALQFQGSATKEFKEAYDILRAKCERLEKENKQLHEKWDNPWKWLESWIKAYDRENKTDSQKMIDWIMDAPTCGG